MALPQSPLLLFDPTERKAYGKAVDWLLSADVQKKLMQPTQRLPVKRDFEPSGPLSVPIGNVPSFRRSGAVGTYRGGSLRCRPQDS
ncbi:hypothetical protein [Streptomyces sp. bgisy060]|uniref:hypothetical protein n=1 Tax=Streptomyces sp. bgisy060 TaxID=3413775 RepID=UPI003EC0F1FA